MISKKMLGMILLLLSLWSTYLAAIPAILSSPADQDDGSNVPPAVQFDSSPSKAYNENLSFLKRHGYLKEGREHDVVSVHDAIKMMQGLQGLQESGVFDKATLSVMKRTCPHPDVLTGEERDKRYNYTRSWGKLTFTYNIFSYPSKTKLSYDKVNSIIADAFKIWMRADPKIKVTKTDSKACDISINFFSKDHGDGYPFDRKRSVNILGHGFYPRKGILDFDDSETWGDGTEGTKSLLYTATHEIGHVFGLQHSKVETAIMYDKYPSDNPPVVLHRDDIDGINFLY